MTRAGAAFPTYLQSSCPDAERASGAGKVASLVTTITRLMSAPAAVRRALSTLPGSSSPEKMRTLPVFSGGWGKKPEVRPAVT